MARRIRIRRLARGLGIGAVVVAGLVLLVTLLVFVRPLREHALEQILAVASDSLPGTLEYDSANWPGLSRVELRDVRWQDGPTQFAAATRIAVAIDLQALLRKDLHVRTLALEGVTADLPKIRAVLSAGGADETGEVASDGPAFPREGAIPGVPSIAVDSLHVELVRLDADEGISLRLALGLSVDTQFDHPPVLSIRTLDAAWIERGWNLRSEGLDVAVASGEFSGGIHADLGDLADLDLTLATTGPRAFSLRATERGVSEDLLHLEGTFEQHPNGLIQSLDFDLDLMTPESARIDSLLQRQGTLAPLNSFGRILVEAQGTLSLEDTAQTEASVQVSASEWSGRIEARLRQIGAQTWLDDLRIEDDGMLVTGSGSYAAAGYEATVQAEVTDPVFLEKIDLAEGVPTDTKLSLDLKLDGVGSELRPTLSLTGSAHSVGLDSLDVRATGKVAGPDSDLQIVLRTLVRDSLAIGIDGRVRDLERPQVHLTPVRVRETLAQLQSSGAVPPDRPNLRFDPEGQVVAIEGLRVTGGLGELRLDGDLSQASGGEGRLQIQWPEPPAALGLAGFTADARDSLLAPHWSRDGIPGIDLRFEVSRGFRSASVDGTIALPAPWSALPGLAPEAYDSSQLQGTATADWEQSGPWSAALDFASTTWLDSAFVHLRGFGSAVHLDSMLVRGGPVRATAAATLDSSHVDGKFQLDLHSHPALALVAPELPPDLDFLLNLRAGVAGDPAAPDARVKLLASARNEALRLPLVSVEVEVVEGVPESARIEIPEHARVGQMRIAHALIAARPQDPRTGLFPLGVSGEIEGDLLWSQLAWIDSIGGAWQVRTDSLRIGTLGHVLESQRPFTFEFAPADSTLRLDGMDLAGAPGTIEASFDLGPGRAQADVDLHLDGSIPSAFVQMPARMLPTGYHLVATGDQDDLEASLWIEGIKLGSRNDILARVDSRRDGKQVHVEIRAHDQLGRLASGSMTLPMRTDLVTRSFQWHDGPLTGKVEVDSLPLPYKIGGGEGLSAYLLGARDESAPLADALLLLGGTGSQPVVGAQIGVGFPQIEGLKEDRLQLGAIWIGREGDAASLDLFDEDMLERMRLALPHGGVAVLGNLKRGEAPLATVRAGFPLTEDASSPFPTFAPEDPVVFSVSAEPLRLADWQSLLPRGTEVGGELWLRATGEGPLGDFPLEGSVRMQGLRYRQSFGNSATLNGNIDVTGSSAAPVIKGLLTVPNALVRLPKSSRALHDVEGGSKLWNLGLMPRDEFAALDSLEVEWGWTFDAPDSTADDEPRLTLAESTELDVKIEIPNSFWIRGQGLDVQLAGELHLELRNGVPIVVGELRALSGTLEVVGARLRLDRGVVTFYGGDTTNPGLDLELTRDIGDVRVRVRVAGTAMEPRLAFESDPPMSQSDIMSYLIFGSSAGDLDGAQTQLLQTQAAAALSQFAAPMLENELTQSLGISMMQLRAGEDPNDGLSLVVGRYVTPQILVKYEQSLKDRQKYTVNAEYWLTRNLRIETRLSEARSTGIELNWSTDY